MVKGSRLGGTPDLVIFFPSLLTTRRIVIQPLLSSVVQDGAQLTHRLQSRMGDVLNGEGFVERRQEPYCGTALQRRTTELCPGE